MIVSKARIIEEYESIKNKFKNDALRFADVSLTLGIHVNLVVQTVNENDSTANIKSNACN
jgi:hypothetical protein